MEARHPNPCAMCMCVHARNLQKCQWLEVGWSLDTLYTFGSNGKANNIIGKDDNNASEEETTIGDKDTTIAKERLTDNENTNNTLTKYEQLICESRSRSGNQLCIRYVNSIRTSFSCSLCVVSKSWQSQVFFEVGTKGQT